MTPIDLRTYGGELIQVGYSESSGDYYYQVFDRWDSRPMLAGTCASVVDLIAETRGEVDWKRHGSVLSRLVVASGHAKTEAIKILIAAMEVRAYDQPPPPPPAASASPAAAAARQRRWSS